jgi:hypothetical protein
MTGDEDFYGEREIGIMRSAIERKLSEINVFKEKISQSGEEGQIRKYEDIVDFLYSDIVGYKTAISEITGEDFTIADLDYDTDLVPRYDAEEVYDMYLEELDMETKIEDSEQMSLKAEFFSDFMDQSYFNVGLQVMTDVELREKVMNHDAVLINIGKAVMEEDSLRKFFL